MTDMAKKRIAILLAIGAIVVFTLVSGVPRGHSEGRVPAYDPHGKRDPFLPLIGQGKTSTAAALEDVATVDDLRLEGIASDSKGKRMAILNGELVKQGEKVGIVEIVSVEEKSVKILLGDKEFTIKLSEEEGGVSGG